MRPLAFDLFAASLFRSCGMQRVVSLEMVLPALLQLVWLSLSETERALFREDQATLSTDEAALVTTAVRWVCSTLLPARYHPAIEYTYSTIMQRDLQGSDHFSTTCPICRERRVFESPDHDVYCKNQHRWHMHSDTVKIAASRGALCCTLCVQDEITARHRALIPGTIDCTGHILWQVGSVHLLLIPLSWFDDNNPSLPVFIEYVSDMTTADPQVAKWIELHSPSKLSPQDLARCCGYWKLVSTRE